MPQTSHTPSTKPRRMPSLVLSRIFEAQLAAQSSTDAEVYDAQTTIRDGAIRKLSTLQRMRIKLALGVLDRLIER